MIVFTKRELVRAWRQASLAFESASKKTNAHRLLLFYAVETGLKAVILKRENRSDSEDKFGEIQHDLNKLLMVLRAGKTLQLPGNIQLPPLAGNKQRNAECADLNQVWRYGAQAQNPSDVEFEAKLSEINDWIKGELR